MAFPYTYKNKIELLDTKVKGNKLNTSTIIKLVANEIVLSNPEVFSVEDNYIQYSIKSNILKYNYKINLFVEKAGNDHNVIFEIDLEKVLRIIITGVILIAFFSFLSVKYF